MSAVLSRNAPCACGSGKRYKQCCGQLGGGEPGPTLPPDAIAKLGQALASSRWRGAESLARGLLDRHPRDGKLWQALAVALTQQGQDGLEAWRSATIHLPNDAASHHNLANACARAGRIDEAIGCWRRATALQPTLIEAHLNLGEALQGREQPDEALAAFRHAIALDPSRLEGLVGVGAICLANGRLGE